MSAAVAAVRRSLPGRALRRFGEAKGQRWATVVGWNALFSFFPIVLAVIGVLGLLLQGTGAAQTVRDHVIAAFPSDGDRQDIAKALDSVQQHGGVVEIVGIVTLFWGGSALFGAIEQALDALYPTKPRSFVPQKLMGFQMIVLFTVLAVPMMASASLLPALSSIPGVPDVLTSGVLAQLIQVGAGLVMGTALFLCIFTIVPHRKVSVRRALPGAVASGVLLEALTLLFPLYFVISHGFNRYGQTFALFFLLMNFFYFFGMITMLGGALNAILDPASKPLPDEERRIGGGLAQPEQPPALAGEPQGGTAGSASAGNGRQPAPTWAHEALVASKEALDRERGGVEKAAETAVENRGVVLLGVGTLVGVMQKRLRGRRRG